MVARNFLEIDANIMYPRVDMAGNLTGITGMEFPLLNYLIFLIAKVFGYQHWYGRLVVLVVSSIGTWYFYRLIKEQFDQKTAFIAGFLLLFSLWFAYSRKIMPDTFATSLLLIGIYYGFSYLKNTKITHLFLYFVFGLLGLLAKLPVVFMMVYFIFPLLDGKLLTKPKIYFCLVSIAVFVPVLWWYFVWTPYLTSHYGFWHFFMGKDILTGIQETWQGIDIVLERLFYTPLGIAGVLLLPISLAYFIYKKEYKPFVIYVIGLLTFIVLVVFKAGWTFYHHNYYILVFVPVFIVPIAVYIQKIPCYLGLIILLAASVEGVARQYHEFFIKDNHLQLLQLEKDLSPFFTQKDRIAINSELYPTPLYFAHIKGITIKNSDVKSRYLTENKFAGIVILKEVFGTDTTLSYPLLFENKAYKIYRIETK
jgi:hypothetical protein